tara:strand:+ start:502 stop:2058 length:1557 start_codon:yes stop_codon:yes gene_type:complete
MSNNLTNKKIQSTYQRVLHVGDDGLMYDGTGSLYTPVSASHEITTETSSSHAINADTASFVNNLQNLTVNNLIIDQTAGTDNSVVVLSGEGKLLTDEIDVGVWGATGPVITAEGDTPAPTVATIAGLAPNTATTQATQAAITTCINLTTVGTIGGGIWEGEPVASAYLDADTAHLTTTQTFSGLKTFSAPITASGNISSSGIITAHSYLVSSAYRLLDSGGTSRHVLTNGSDDLKVEIGNANMTSGVSLVGNVTASGNISSSGTVTAAGVRLPGAGIISFDDTLDGTDQMISGNDNNIIIDGDEIIKLRADSTIEFQDASNNAQVTVNPIAGHITASGNISASGNIYANEIYGYQISMHPSNFKVNLNGSYYYAPLTGQSLDEHASSNANERVPLVGVYDGKPLKTVIRSTTNTGTNQAKMTCSIHFEPPWNNDVYPSASPSTVAPGLNTNGHRLYAESYRDGPNDNHGSVSFDWKNPNSGSWNVDIPSGSRITLSVKSDFASSTTYIVNTAFMWNVR